jgi:hypothetical protein
MKPFTCFIEFTLLRICGGNLKLRLLSQVWVELFGLFKGLDGKLRLILFYKNETFQVLYLSGTNASSTRGVRVTASLR